MDLTPIIGGALIGLAASLLLFTHGRVAGISGIVGGLIRGESLSCRAPFVIGLLLSAPLALLTFTDGAEFFANTTPRSVPLTALAGLLVGFGSRLGNGCTSGHGVCGLARGSKRSFAATLTFMTTGALMAYVTQHIIAG
jgi:uncharacterized membrane protein YedE/YeeE